VGGCPQPDFSGQGCGEGDLPLMPRLRSPARPNGVLRLPSPDWANPLFKTSAH
jgi:hypothetical protein